MRKIRGKRRRIFPSKQREVRYMVHSEPYTRWLRFLNRVNISRHIALHLIGQDHTPTHRKVAGVLIMVFGGLVIGSALFTHSLLLHVAADVVGNSFHGIGLIPFVKDVERIEKQIS